jgi:DNA primase
VAFRGNGSGSTDTQIYAPLQIRAVLRAINVEIVSQTGNDFLCLCPFHGNRNTPSFSVSKERGAFICFNPSCGEAGSIIELVKKMTDRNDFESIRLIASKEEEIVEDFEERLSDMLVDSEDLKEFDMAIIAKLSSEMSGGNAGRDYMHMRGFNDQTILDFDIGFSSNQQMVTVPVHSADGKCIGIVGRHITEKRFKNSPGLPKSKTVFNIHRAKKVSPVAIVTEASFDAMRLHQAGFPNGVATLGGHISNDSINLLNKYFTKVIIMTDNDQAGRELGLAIVKKLKGKEVLWAVYDQSTIYPHGAKDVGDMTDEEIKHCVNNAIPHYEYSNNMIQ